MYTAIHRGPQASASPNLAWITILAACQPQGFVFSGRRHPDSPPDTKPRRWRSLSHGGLGNERGRRTAFTCLGAFPLSINRTENQPALDCPQIARPSLTGIRRRSS